MLKHKYCQSKLVSPVLKVKLWALRKFERRNSFLVKSRPCSLTAVSGCLGLVYTLGKQKETVQRAFVFFLVTCFLWSLESRITYLKSKLNSVSA